MLPTPYLLILGGMSSGIQAIWPPRVAVLFQFGRALLRNQRALSGKPMFWQPYRCTTPVAGLVVSQALWIRSLQVGRPRSTADLQRNEHFPPPVQLNSILRIVGMVLCQPNCQSRSPLSGTHSNTMRHTATRKPASRRACARYDAAPCQAAARARAYPLVNTPRAAGPLQAHAVGGNERRGLGGGLGAGGCLEAPVR